MAETLIDFEGVKTLLRQRFPFLMVDTVQELVPGERIVATKNVTGNEIQFLGHFEDFAIMPGTLIVEAMGQAASILFSRSTDLQPSDGGFLVLGAIREMRFLAPVVPGDCMRLDVRFVKLAGEVALVEGTVSVNERVVAVGKLGFARRELRKVPLPAQSQA